MPDGWQASCGATEGMVNGEGFSTNAFAWGGGLVASCTASIRRREMLPCGERIRGLLWAMRKATRRRLFRFQAPYLAGDGGAVVPSTQRQCWSGAVVLFFSLWLLHVVDRVWYLG